MRVLDRQQQGQLEAIELDDDYLIEGDNLEVLRKLPSGAFDLIYVDPPFNTGKRQVRQELKVTRAAEGAAGDRGGFGGRRYHARVMRALAYDDAFDDYLEFLGPRLEEAQRLMADDGTLYVHLDYREAHYVKVLLDIIFGRDNFLNEIIWAYDYGGKSKRKWPAKHDTVLVYVKDAKRYHYDSSAVDREPYMAPGLVTPEKVEKGKLPTDVWWHTIVPTNGKEKTGYPTQKPEGVVKRMVLASSRPSGWCLDFFAGSGTLGAVAAKTGRRFVLVDSSPDALAVSARRLAPLVADH